MEGKQRDQLAEFLYRIANKQRRLVDLVDDPEALTLITETILDVNAMTDILDSMNDEEK